MAFLQRLILKRLQMPFERKAGPKLFASSKFLLQKNKRNIFYFFVWMNWCVVLKK